MNKIVYVGIILALLLACSPPVEIANVSGKRYIPPQEYEYNCGCAFRTKEGLCTMHFKCDGIKPERWVVKITADLGDGKHWSDYVSVSQIEFENISLDECACYRNKEWVFTGEKCKGERQN